VRTTKTATHPQPTMTVTALLPHTLYRTQTLELLVPPGCIEAQVVEIVDGDTINVCIDGQEYAVRYIGIEAPERHHPEKGVEWMGPEATRANEDLVSRRYLRERGPGAARLRPVEHVPAGRGASGPVPKSRAGGTGG